jgi:hypothetical protein
MLLLYKYEEQLPKDNNWGPEDVNRTSGTGAWKKASALYLQWIAPNGLTNQEPSKVLAHLYQDWEALHVALGQSLHWPPSIRVIRTIAAVASTQRRGMDIDGGDCFDNVKRTGLNVAFLLLLRPEQVLVVEGGRRCCNAGVQVANVSSAPEVSRE